MRLITVILLALLPFFAAIAYADPNMSATYIIPDQTMPIPPDAIPAKAAPFMGPRIERRVARKIRTYHYTPFNFCNGPITIVAYPGSLRNNIRRIAARCGWHTVWNPPYDYRWYGHTAISGESLMDALRKMLKNYPVQAAFYSGNHILAIEPRNLYEKGE